MIVNESFVEEMICNQRRLKLEYIVHGEQKHIFELIKTIAGDAARITTTILRLLLGTMLNADQDGGTGW